ncbi:MAG: ribosome biogenesis GTPase YlqF [Oscillospiraceae bacterium]|nr:ribosome biogenesis GTPase YlqF [Oscillospiraceae bacterium]
MTDGGIPKINWFPGHMTKALRTIEEDLRQVDAVCEIIDARIPISSRNPELGAIVGSKPRMIILNRCDLADAAATGKWLRYFRERECPVLETDSKSGKGTSAFPGAVRALLKDRLRQYAAKGQTGRPVRVMVAGVPNVGKSTFINKVAKRKAAAASDRPGVTRGRQWISVDRGLEMLDTPGVLWPKFEDPAVGLNLAFTGAVKDEVVDTEELAAALMERLSGDYAPMLASRYGLGDVREKSGRELLEAAAGKRGFLISGGEKDTLRMAAVLLDEFRAGKIGRISLEEPDA